MLETQSDVRLEMREPETPGGFKFIMAWRPDSRSVTADAMMVYGIPGKYECRSGS